MKKLSFVLLVTLLLGLCSCAPKPNGAEIFDIKDPQSITLTHTENTILSALAPIDSYLYVDDAADMDAIFGLLNGLTLTEIEPQNHALNHYSVRIQCQHMVRNIIVSGSVFHCSWTGKVYRADRDITEELKSYLTRDVGKSVDAKAMLDPESITRITVDNSVWEPIEMTDISPAVEVLSKVSLTRINPPLHEGGTQVTLYYGDQTQGLNFSGTTVWIDHKAYRCDTDISQIFSQVVHPES